VIGGASGAGPPDWFEKPVATDDRGEERLDPLLPSAHPVSDGTVSVQAVVSDHMLIPARALRSRSPGLGARKAAGGARLAALANCLPGRGGSPIQTGAYSTELWRREMVLTTSEC